MNFIKRHIFYIACAVGAAAGIALAVTGLGAMPKVEEELKKAKGIHDSLGMLMSKPANKTLIEAKNQRIEKVREDADKVLNRARELYGYQPLVPDVFPNGPNDARFRFRVRYNEEMNTLLQSLRWGTVPDSQDITMMEEQIEKELFQESQRGLDVGAAPDENSPRGPDYTDSGVLTKAGVKQRSEERAAIKKALTINVYATPKQPKQQGGKPLAPSSLQYHEYMDNTGELEPPIIEDVWWAQLQYWIQKDVVDAIVAVNEEAGDQATKNGGDRWVGIMPVKEVISLRISDGYILDDDDSFVGAAASGYNMALPPGTRNTVFTNSQSGPAYDVLQFTLKLIMDQRDIMKLVQKICANKFHSLLRVSYTAVEPNRYMLGKIYGPEPVVNVVLDFETIMIPSVFHNLMPAEVCDQYDHITCPKSEEDGEEE